MLGTMITLNESGGIYGGLSSPCNQDVTLASAERCISLN